MDCFPSSLAVYLSNRCNLACPYCYVAVNQGAAVSLNFDGLKRGLDYFLSRAPASGRKVSFLGGEPLLNFPLMERAVDYIRASAGNRPAVHLFTNGTLLNRRRLDFFLDRGVDVVLSLHGGGGTGLKNPSRAGLGASLVVTPQSAPGLLRRIDRLYREGFRKISFSPDAACFWRVEDAGRFLTAMEGFLRYYTALARGGAELFEISNIYEALEEALGRRAAALSPCDHLILAADGKFYACDKMLGLPLEQLSFGQVGSPEVGLDARGRDAYFKEALDACAGAEGSRRSSCHCPVGTYTLWKLNLGRPSGGLRARVGSFRRVSEIFSGGLSRLAGELKDNPAFRRVHHVAG